MPVNHEQQGHGPDAAITFCFYLCLHGNGVMQAAGELPHFGEISRVIDTDTENIKALRMLGLVKPVQLGHFMHAR